MRTRSIAAVVAAWLVLGGAVARAESVVEARTNLYLRYAEQLDDLAKTLAASGFPEVAAEARAWFTPREPGKIYLFPFPEGVPHGERVKPFNRLADGRKTFLDLRAAQANALVKLSQRALEEKRPSLAYELVAEAAHENPNLDYARRFLGHVNYQNEWRTPYEADQLAKGNVWIKEFGWLPAAQVERYRKGERPFKGSWKSVAEDARLHRKDDIQKGWRVNGEYYSVLTNDSFESGVALARQLDQLSRVWRQVFVHYNASDEQLKKWFDGHRVPEPKNKLKLAYYFGDREQYNRALKPFQSKIDMTLGIYLGSTQTAYFFAGKGQDPGTVLHEATHQQFSETRPNRGPVTKQLETLPNAWVIEGVACYMETLTDHGGYLTLGGLDVARGPGARVRLLQDNFYVPLNLLVNLTMDSLQGDERIATLYTESAGLVDFLMHYDSGRYREALVDYLAAIYSGHANDQTLARLTTGDYNQLDRQYREFLGAYEAIHPLVRIPAKDEPEPESETIRLPRPRR